MTLLNSNSRKCFARIFSAALLCCLLLTAEAQEQLPVETDVPALKDVFANDFYFGCLLSYAHIGFPDDPPVAGQSPVTAATGGDLIKYHMNSMSPGNWMKSTYIVNVSGSAAAYTAAASQEEKDSIDVHPIVTFNGNIIAQLNWAQRQGFTFRGHTLVWHNQHPGTAFFRSGYTAGGARLSKEKMTERMENFIKETMRIINENWPGLLTAMDVVNEAVNDNGTDRTASNEWYDTFGDISYVMKAFEFARKYSVQYGETQMKLYYNDYNTHVAAKADGIVRICRPIFEAGYLDGIGMQDHDAYNSPTAQQWIASYDKFATVSTEIAVTELDVRPSSNTLTSAVLTTQANQYAMLFKCFLDRSYRSGRGKLISVTKDGLNDDPDFSFVDYASLWDEQNQCKPAFYEVVEMTQNYYALDSLINHTDTLSESDYDPVRWKEFADALAAAQQAMNANYSYSVSAADALGNAHTKLITAIETLDDPVPPAITGIADESEGVLVTRIYPNPAKSAATIEINLSQKTNVRLVLYNKEGRVVSKLVNGNLNGGNHQINVDASNLPTGIYFYSLVTDGHVVMKKLAVSK